MGASREASLLCCWEAAGSEPGEVPAGGRCERCAGQPLLFVWLLVNDGFRSFACDRVELPCLSFPRALLWVCVTKRCLVSLRLQCSVHVSF